MLPWRTDPLKLGRSPGPCPVDDHPHTACCSVDYQPTDRKAIVVTPFEVATSVTIGPAPAPASPAASVTFTTTSYRRKLHGREALAKQARARQP